MTRCGAHRVAAYLRVKMRLTRTSARVALMNLKMRNFLVINDAILKFMGKLGGDRQPQDACQAVRL